MKNHIDMLIFQTRICAEATNSVIASENLEFSPRAFANKFASAWRYIMDILTLTNCFSTAELQNDIGIAVMSKALDQFEETSEGMQKILEASVNPNLGQNIDYRV